MPRPPLPAFARPGARFLLRSYRRLLELTLGRLAHALPMRDNLVVYSSLWHRSPSGNPLAVYRKQLELAPHLEPVWVVEKRCHADVPAGVRVVTPRSATYLRTVARAKYFVDDANPYWGVRPRKGQVYLQTHHGTALKYMGADRHYSGERPTDGTIVTMHRRSQRWTHSLSTSPYLTEVWERAYSNPAVQLGTGFPRNDRLVNAVPEDRTAARQRLGISGDTRAVLYMPTWRTRSGPDEESFDLLAFASQLPQDVTLLVRDHYFHDRHVRSQIPQAVVDVSTGWEVEDLYAASDLLVTDYSSAMFDYALVDKPIVIFAYDWDDYRHERGAYFDITADAPGQVVTTADALATALADRKYESVQYLKRLASFRERFCTYETGNAAELAVRVALLGEDGPVVSGDYGAHPEGWTRHPRVSHPDDPAREQRL